MLGAIDPARIGDLTLYEADARDLDRTELAIELINNYLVGGLCAARNRVAQDRMAFAIQELLRVLECNGSVIDTCEANTLTQGKRLSKPEQSALETWNRLSESSRAVVRPYLHSTYELLDERAPIATFGPIYSPSRDRQWLCLWAQRLLTKVDGSVAAVFKACR